jgi:cysteine desulfurase
MMKRIYLDNAATTQIDPEVVAEMSEILQNCYGNPSSIHAFGRQARTVIERARKKIADILHVSPSEIFFTSGGTEANNLALRNTIKNLGIKHAITSPIEHHAVLHTLQELAHDGQIKLSIVNIDKTGKVDFNHLESLLNLNSQSLVSIMHANNEIGTINDIYAIGELCRKYNAIFHTDAVQTMGHFQFNLSEMNVHFTNCAAHKFHGPKGVGFCYIKGGIHIHPLITGGAQERNMRAGTENIYGIAGLAKAMEIANRDYEKDHKYIRGLKNLMINKLKAEIPDVEFNGDISDDSLYTVLNVCLPETADSDMLLFKLDISGICASGGSACSSGSNVGSHVIAVIRPNTTRPCIRFSFSKFNTPEEIEQTVNTLKKIYDKHLISH